jgi:hypothetical protein
MDDHYYIRYESQGFLFGKWSVLSFKQEFVEITLAVEILDNAQAPGIVEKIVYYFDNEWMSLLFHQPYLFL